MLPGLRRPGGFVWIELGTTDLKNLLHKNYYRCQFEYSLGTEMGNMFAKHCYELLLLFYI